MTTLHFFEGTEGGFPGDLLLAPDGAFYGTLLDGGPGASHGTIYRFTR